MSEKFLILGASSFYGSNFAKLVQEKGDEIYEIKSRLGASLIGLEAFDYVVNFASKSLVAESWEFPSEWMRVNAVDTTLMFDEFLESPPKKFIHVSTPEVYGSTKGWVSEQTPFNPSTPYAVSRAAADMMLAAYGRAYQFPYCITRTANIYGLGQGENRIIPRTFTCLRNGEKLKLEGGGHSVRGFIHVRDACEATYLVCKKGMPSETYHIATRHLITIEALVKMICAIVGKTFNDCVEIVPDRLGKDFAYRLDSTKVRALGWDDKIRLSEGLKEYANHSVDHQASRRVPEEPRAPLQSPG